MTSDRRTVEERLYHLLPAVHRIRDAAQGEPLRALLAVLEHELLVVRDDTQRLYDDWFIETCAEWVVPYLGDLLGVELMRSLEAEGFTTRGYVANTLRYRRRKGTAAVLEGLARDVTGWPTRAVEYFERLTWSQHVQHRRLHAPVAASLRAAAQLELLDGPFGTEQHTGEVRSIVLRRGRFNIPNVGLHVWRLRHYPLEQVDARPVEAAGVEPGRYTFDALGRSGPLFNAPRAETDVTHLAEERDVPAPLRRRALHAELRALVERGEPPPRDGWFGAQPVLRVFRVDAGTRSEIAPPALRICHLVPAPDDPASDWPRPSAGEVLVDPEAGRLSFPPPAVEATPDAVLVDYSYGFAGDLGSGPYDRRRTVPERLEPTAPPGTFQHGVSRDLVAEGTETIHRSLSDAIDAWNADALDAWTRRASLERVIVVMDSRSYVEELTLASGRCIVVPPGARLRLVAARWPREVADPVLGGWRRSEGRLEPMGVRPHLRGHLEIIGLQDPTGAIDGGALELDGFLIEGSVTVRPGALGALSLRHSTLVPGMGGLRIDSTQPLTGADRELGANADLDVEILRSIADGVSLTGALGGLRVTDSIVDGGAAARAPSGPAVTLALGSSALAGAVAARLADPSDVLALLAATAHAEVAWTALDSGASIVADDADVRVERSTLFGSTRVRSIHGSESIFVADVLARVVQVGCLRYSYAPSTSRAPRRFRCQPDGAVAAAQAAAADAGLPFDADDVEGRVRPTFTSSTYGHPAFAQLTRATPEELREGAEDGSEMGAFCFLAQPHRESNLRTALEQYLRFGLDAGIFFVT